MTEVEPLLFAVSVLGTLVVLLTFIVRGREIGLELSSETAFAFYVRMASLAGSVVFTIGLAEILRAWLVTLPLQEGYTPLTTRLSVEQLIRGATLLVAGGGFWLMHFFLPRPAVPGGGLLYLAFLMVGTAAFGLAALMTLPVGLAQELQRVFGLNNVAPRTGGTLGGGLAALVAWLGHLWQLRNHFGRGGYRAQFVRIPPRSAPPTEPSISGAPLVRPPDAYSAGAAARPPDDE